MFAFLVLTLLLAVLTDRSATVVTDDGLVAEENNTEVLTLSDEFQAHIERTENQ
ncbi:hypothetical protein MNBD_BACTEROID03-553 [hydrothermal vent metagenome]|uniref:Uncharacterized protein n=1 Tax=hydrothermal vent metagenome TaxID=652676 RepID=A0A3B0T2Z3_9ZZZZ